MSVQDLLNQFRAGVWLKNAAGQPIWVAEGLCNDYDQWFGCQCLDLADLWEQYLGLPLLAAPAAIDTWSLNPDPSQYQKIPNTPTDVPEPGDILVFGNALGWQYGHIVIVLTANLNSFVSLDQNWYNSNETVGSPAAQVTHDYSAVLGWFRPIVAAPAPTPPPAAEAVIFSGDA